MTPATTHITPTIIYKIPGMSSSYNWEVVSQSQSWVADDETPASTSSGQVHLLHKGVDSQAGTELGITDNDRASVCRIMFNAPFYRSVGFSTKRAADSLVSSLSCIYDMYICAVEDVIKVITHNRNRVKAYLLTEHEHDVCAANAKDKKVSEDIKQARIKKHIEQEYHEARARRTEEQERQLLDLERRLEQTSISQDNESKRHFCEIEMICRSDPHNSISVQVLSYMKNNCLV